MVYGGFARSLSNKGGGNFVEQVSESDAVLEFLMNECDNYSNMFLTESFVDEKERIVAEAKLQALQEAVTGAIIAAIIAVLTAIIALILKFSGMLKKGSEALKKKFSKEKAAKALTPEQVEEIKAKVKPLVDGINFRAKDRLMYFSDAEFGTGPIDDVKKNINDLKSSINSLINTINSSSDVQAIKSECDKFKKHIDEIEFDNTAMDQIKQTNLFYEMMIGETIMDMGKAVQAAKSMIDNKYFDKATKMQDEITREIDDLKKVVESNGRKVQAKVHPDAHGGGKEWTEVSAIVNGGFKTVKDVCGVIKLLISQWAEAERFRLSYANILASYA